MFRQELILAFVLIPTAIFLNISNLEKVLLIIPVFIILIAELFNSAIEGVVDRIGFEHPELSGYTKDAACAAVLISCCIFAIIIGS